MNKTFLGVDAGATKTHALILDESGNTLGFGHGACGNHEVNGYAGARQSVLDATSEALAQSGLAWKDITQSAFCMAGVDIPADEREIPVQVLRPVLGDAPFVLKNDAFGCLRGGTLEPFGVMINCGTGQVAVGRSRAGNEIRVGGYGWEYGDFGGGNVMTHGAVAAIIRGEDGRGPTTLLKDLVLDHTGCASVAEFHEKTYRNSQLLWTYHIPRLVFRASVLGDEAARTIVLGVAREMELTALALIRRLDLVHDEFDVITAGSVFKGEDPVFIESIRAGVHAVSPGARFRMPAYQPVVGCALIAFETVGGNVDAEYHANLRMGLPPSLSSGAENGSD